MEHHNLTVLTMDFGKRLATLRRERGLTQPALADHINLHVSQLRRYEAGTHARTGVKLFEGFILSAVAVINGIFPALFCPLKTSVPWIPIVSAANA